MRDFVLEMLSELRDQVQYMREEGERDMRTVLMHIDDTIREIQKEWTE